MTRGKLNITRIFKILTVNIHISNVLAFYQHFNLSKNTEIRLVIFLSVKDSEGDITRLHKI